MPDTVSMIRTAGKPLSVEAERKQHSDWVKQEAQLLMDELFLNIDDPRSTHPSEQETVDVDWVEGLSVQASSEMAQTWASLTPEFEDEEYWVPPSRSAPFYQNFLMILGGLAVVVPLSVWGIHTVRQAAQSRAVVAAPPIQMNDQMNDHQSDADFASYATQALRQIEENANAPKPTTPLGITSLPQVKIGDRAIPATLPPVAIAAPAQPKPLPASPAPSATNAPALSQATPAEIDRLTLRVFKPKQAIQSEVPAVSPKAKASHPQSSGANTSTSSAQTLPAPPSTSTITPAPSDELPTLTPHSTVPSTIAAATPMTSPASNNKKVIGIIELGLQSTLMVSNNGSHLNFKVGDIVNDAGWKLVQITQGKAVLQKGTEYKTLSEGQYF